MSGKFQVRSWREGASSGWLASAAENAANVSPGCYQETESPRGGWG